MTPEEKDKHLTECVGKMFDFMNTMNFEHPLDMLFVLQSVQHAVVLSLYESILFTVGGPSDSQASAEEREQAVQILEAEGLRLPGFPGV